MSEYFELSIKNNEPVNVRELNSYLTKIEGLYSFFKSHPELLKEVDYNSVSKGVLTTVTLVKKIQEIVLNSKYSDRDLNSFYNLKKRRNSDLEIVHLSKNSPLLIVFGTAVIALTAAVILSGGEVDAEFQGAKFKFKLPDLASGLIRLEEFKQKVRYNREERKTLPEVKEQLGLVEGRKDLDFEIQVLKKAREVEGLDAETIQNLTDEIDKKEIELNNLN
tara:strand:- start:5749 stop:6408 length:660 start_codon:yes stop_codon:yes gene_type:complete